MKAKFTAFFNKVVALLVTIIFALSNIASTGLSLQVKPKNAEALRLSFAAFSDSHLAGDEDSARVKVLYQGLRNLDGRVDAIVAVGDMTDRGEREQYETFYRCVKKEVTSSKFIAAVGNHDTWTTGSNGENPTYEFLRAYNGYSGKNLTEAYYTEEVKGYTFIVLATEADNTSAYLSEKQISWLDSELEKATESGKPAFVLCHWPLDGTCGQMEIDPEHGMGAQSAEVQAVLEKYKNVFYFSGHIHAGLRGELSNKIFGHQSVETINGVHYINLPSFMFPNTRSLKTGNGGNILPGCGYIAEVYENEVVLRARNYPLGFYMPVYEKTIDLVK